MAMTTATKPDLKMDVMLDMDHPIERLWTPEQIAKSLGTTREFVTSNIRRFGFRPVYQIGPQYDRVCWLSLRIVLELQRMLQEPRSALPFKIVMQSQDAIRDLCANPDVATIIGFSDGKLHLTVGLSIADLLSPQER